MININEICFVNNQLKMDIQYETHNKLFMRILLDKFT